MPKGKLEQQKAEFRREVGARIREKRIQAGYRRGKQGKFAEKIGVSQGVLSRYESGEVEIPLLMLKRICEELRISSDEVMGLVREV